MQSGMAGERRKTSSRISRINPATAWQVENQIHANVSENALRNSHWSGVTPPAAATADISSTPKAVSRPVTPNTPSRVIIVAMRAGSDGDVPCLLSDTLTGLSRHRHRRLGRQGRVPGLPSHSGVQR